ncbi:DUF1543 domain-containing protein [Chitinophaga vietnamensis]|uniref:DUF1543 domain-containing protein n=1 Tax=Chitinophaga vietnamensis TaxID=2593957 RepID=UPI001F382D4D|nr:DUF1543 domain-containing protein [Chitinophaga vietnamensis]
MKLFMVLLGSKPEGRHTEQHDVFFGIARELRDLVPDIKAFWPEAKDKLHIDGWREVNYVDNFHISVDVSPAENPGQLFFLNLGGYKPNELEEFHYKLLRVGKDVGEAIRSAKETTFYKHTGFGDLAASHVDDKYGVDVDDVHAIADILPAHMKGVWHLKVTPVAETREDEIHLGYFQLHKL